MSRVLVAPDKFKGTLTAAEVADALDVGLRSRGVGTTLLPLADGGDGSVAAAVASGMRAEPVVVPDALGRPHEATVALQGRTAVVEIAGTCGLAILGGTGRDVAVAASSRGLGVAARHALDRGARDVVLALGGSVSTDAGAGFLQGLGARLLDADGREVAPGGGSLHLVASIDLADLHLPAGTSFTVASDVTAPLLGPDGAAAVFGPQKGASPADVVLLERNLEHFARLLADAAGLDHATLVATPGTGAAGGVGLAAAALGGRLVSGAAHFLDLTGFDDAVAGADAVVTGEGGLDAQTLLGKLPAIVAERSAPRPVHAAVGVSLLPATARTPFASVHAVSALTGADTRTDPELTVRLLGVVGATIADGLR